MTEVTPSELRDIRLIAQGAGAERERIIKLLEELRRTQLYPDEIIALIKGEQK